MRASSTIRRDMYGIVQRGARGPHTVAYDFYPYLYGHGGGIFKDQVAGDYTVMLNSAEGRDGARLLHPARARGRASEDRGARPGRSDPGHGHRQGRAHQMVIAAWSQMDDPTKSAVVDKVEFAPTPHAPGVRRRRPASAIGWAASRRTSPTTASAAPSSSCAGSRPRTRRWRPRGPGGIPISAAVYREPIAEERRFRWMKPLAESLPQRRQRLPVPRGERGHRHPRARPQPRHRRRDRRRVDALNDMADADPGGDGEVRLQDGRARPLP